MREIKTKIYKFSELNENTQNNIINDYINELIQITDFSKLNKNTNLYKAFNECEKLKTPWFLGQYIWAYCKKQILNILKQEEFYKDGKLYLKG